MSKSFLRNIIGEYMSVLGEMDERVVIVNADLSGTCRNRGFSEKYPDRSFNTGIAEQNLVSFSAGLSCEGFIPYVFSMAPFLTMRACEQVRTDVAYGNRNVRLIGVYAGVSGGISGATHWAIEDVGIVSSIPNMAVFEVCDAMQSKKLLDFTLGYSGPIYIRCGVEPTLDIYNDSLSVHLGGSRTIVEGCDGAILCSGVTVQFALEAAESIFNETGYRVRVVDMYSLKPLDADAVIDAAGTGCVLVVQDHNIYGGLGSLVSMELSRRRLAPKFDILGIPDCFVAMAHAPFLYSKFNMDAGGITKVMSEMLRDVHK